MEKTSVPESLRQAVWLWYAVIGLEVVHQGLNVAMTLMNKAVAREQIKQALTGDQSYSDGFINATITLGTAVSALIALAILGGVYYLVRSLREGTKSAGMAQRVLIYFAVYFALRALFLFVSSPDSNLPVALYAVDGCIQIVIGAAAAVAAYLSMNKDAVEWLLKTAPKP
ncbi:hypothetical protein [Corynebacterium vitaeruminis]|uniref:Uncharacterized protein n=1 Tax=Corynebacterium vitaeruminis DSM 20294 TaxID=1224164 RepID=W5XYL5_9CORY|nr:hypothetical protein [Corynebacterium vitaeruminis]AHI21770.1 hypothetical protein B843_01890 [Corynebacterium vitaeruminis DSM 20294]